MLEQPPENNIPDEASGLYPGNEQNPPGQGYTHHHHHHHSHSHQQPSPRTGRNKPTIEDLSRKTRKRQSESFFAKNFLKIAGTIFILAAIWVSISSVGSLKDTLKSIVSKEFFQVNDRHHISLSPGKDTPAQQQEPSFVAGKTAKSNIWIIAGAILALVLMIISFLVRKQEIRIFTLFSWILFGSAWLTRYIFWGDPTLLYGFLAFSSLVYALFFLSGIIRPVNKDKPGWSEYLVIILNGVFYFIAILFLFYKTGHPSYEWMFTLLLLVLNILGVYIADRIIKDYPRLPYVVFILFLVSLLIPLMVRSSMAVLFLASCAVLSMLYSRYTKAQYPLLFSMGSLILLFMAYLAYWIFVYIPAAFLGDIPDQSYIFIKGSWTGAVVLATVYAEFVLLRHAEVTLSKKIFDRGNYMKALKGLLLLVIYLSVFWVYFYLNSYLVTDPGIKSQIWFSFNCLYLIAAIPYLGLQRSFFLKGVFVAGLLLNLAYPAGILFKVMEFRNNFLQGNPASFLLFRYHYICVSLLVVLLFVQLRFLRRAFPRKKFIIHGYYVYFSLFLIFLLLSEFDHLHILLAARRGIMIPAILAEGWKTPYSIILFISSLVILLIGFIRKSRFLRLYSLILIMLVLAKLLLYDIGSMSNSGRTILFFVLGTVLLFISFFYSRIRHFFGRSSHKDKTSEQLPADKEPIKEN